MQGIYGKSMLGMPEDKLTYQGSQEKVNSRRHEDDEDWGRVMDLPVDRCANDNGGDWLYSKGNPKSLEDFRQGSDSIC